MRIGIGKRARSVNQETTKEIAQRFTGAGWDRDDSFLGYLVIGFSGENLSIVAHDQGEAAPAVGETDEIVFEFLDHEKNVSYWVKEVPTPQQAQMLLEEHGELPEKGEQSS
jgi:hypothetical protein